MYTLIGSVRSRAFRVLWLLEELGLSYEHIAAGPRSEDVVAVNPSGKIPVLLVDGAPITDSVAIMSYLADHHGAFTHPAGSLERAQQDSMTNLLIDEIDGLLWTAARHSFILPEEHRVDAIKPPLKWEYTRNAKRLAERMQGRPYLAGEQPTIPDIVLTHCLNWAGRAGFEHGAPELDALAERMRARPAYQRVEAL